MMNNKSLGVLLAAILLMAGAVYIHNMGGGEAADADVGKLVFPGLKANLDKVQEVKFSSVDKTTTIEHTDNRWTIVQKDGYDAAFSRLSSFLGALADARYVERKTSRPDNFGLLGLEGIDNDSSKATNVSIKLQDGTEYNLLIGKKSEGQKGSFVRKPDVEQAWLVSELADVSSEPGTWIDPVVFSIDADQVDSVTDTSADGKQVLTVNRNKDGDGFTIADLPKGAKLKYSNIADSLARGLVNLRIVDARSRGEEPWKNAATAKYGLKDGSVLTIHAMKDDNGGAWLRFDLAASKTPSEAVKFIDQDRLKGFEFKVAGYTFDQLTRTMDDMIDKQAQSGENKSAAKQKAPASGN